MMSRDSPSNDPPPTSFEEWVEKVAASKDVSEEEVYDQMMSSYWIFNELKDFMGGSEAFEASPREREHRQRDRDDERDERSDRSARDRRTDYPRDLEAELGELLSIFELLDQHQSRTVESQSRPRDGRLRRAVDDLEEDVDRLRDDIDRLSNRLDDVRDDQGEREDSFEEHRAALADVSDRVDGVEETLFSGLENLKSRVHELEAEAEDAELLERLEELDRELEALGSQQSAMERRLEKSFGNLEEILKHVFDQLDGVKGRVRPVDELVEDLDRRRDERDRLTALKRRANERGISSGHCERCDQAIDLGLLDYPECPECASPFDGSIEREGWRWFGSNVIQVGSTAEQPGGRNYASSEPGAHEGLPDPGDQMPSEQPGQTEEAPRDEWFDEVASRDDLDFDREDGEFVWGRRDKSK